MEHYIENDAYDRLIEALATLPPCAYTGGPGRCGIKLTLGEVAGVWPDRLRQRAEAVQLD